MKRRSRKNKNAVKPNKEMTLESSTNNVNVGNKILNLTIIISYKLCSFIIFAIIIFALFDKEYSIISIISVGYQIFMIPASILVIASLIKFRQISKE